MSIETKLKNQENVLPEYLKEYFSSKSYCINHAADAWDMLSNDRIFLGRIAAISNSLNMDYRQLDVSVCDYTDGKYAPLYQIEFKFRFIRESILHQGQKEYLYTLIRTDLRELSQSRVFGLKIENALKEMQYQLINGFKRGRQ